MSAIVGLRVKPFFGRFAICAIRANGNEETLATRRDHEEAKRVLASRAEARGMTVSNNGTAAA